MDDRVCGPSWTGPTVSFVRLLSLAGLGATESGIDCGVIGVVTIASPFVSIVPELAGAILASEGPASLSVSKPADLG